MKCFPNIVVESIIMVIYIHSVFLSRSIDEVIITVFFYPWIVYLIIVAIQDLLKDN